MGIFHDIANTLTFGAVDAVGDLMKGAVDRYNNRKLTGKEREQNAFNANEAQKNRDFQQQMASTQYQRAVSDMQSAGINPALAVGNGGNAAPSGNAASGSTSMMQSEGPDFASMILGMKQLQNETKVADSQVAVGNSVITKNEAQAKEALAKAADSSASARHHNAQAESVEITNKTLEESNRLELDAKRKANELTDRQIESEKERKREIMASADLLIKKAETETEQQSLIRAKVLVEKATAHQIYVLTQIQKDKAPHEIALLDANAREKNASADLASLKYLVEQGLIDAGYYISMAEEANGRALDAKEKAKITSIIASIKSGKYFGDDKALNKFCSELLQFLDLSTSTLGNVLGSGLSALLR